jgi:hypothetical protein
VGGVTELGVGFVDVDVVDVVTELIEVLLVETLVDVDVVDVVTELIEVLLVETLEVLLVETLVEIILTVSE